MKDFHFYASSVVEWMVTMNTRQLPDLIAEMDKAGYPYSLFMVPGPWTRNYEIRNYAPEVEGATMLGHFQPPAARKKENRRIEKERDKKIDAELWGVV